MNRRIKLTYLITDLEVGGVPLHLYRLATRLSRETFAIRVICLAEVGPVGERLREAGIPVLGCGARSVWNIGALWRLWQLLVADPPDILHALLFHANIASRFIAPLAGIPPRRIINEIQTVEVERAWHLPVDGLTCRLCRFEVGNSPSVLEHLHRRAGIPWSRLRCEWGAVDAQAIAAAPPLDRAALGVAPDESLLLWTGRLDPVKGFEEMLEAMRRLRSRRRFQFLLCGDGSYRPVVEQIIRSSGLDDRVRLLGQRQDVPSLLRTADAFVFCSRTEGLPNSLLEAMAAGLPIVATNVAGCRDLIRSGQTGLLVEPRCPDAIAEAIETILCDRQQAKRFGERAREWVTHHAELSVWCHRWECLYKNVLGQDF
ncbi:MAG TPA: glycosyltransferase [Phycisphaerae bacterium]|nr:glycosyltransferase [Phycisphaerae bacterium]HOJ74644.1 glycosyltransferase [Phycisphaerae bacterium]HOM50543.1 glycosyltransferase [Phycisphaerae bacterium]HON67378.1 glycosyltransferase [Phycisphaerae bacterium]HOQ84765.1 glycosyltransferase [Phycisphaerae bacterium]